MAKYAVYGADGSPAAATLPVNKAHGVLKQTSGGTGAWEYVVPGRTAADDGDLNPANIATAVALGTAGTFARADHAHDLPFSVVNSVLGESAGTDIAVGGSSKITGVGTPTADSHAATKGYVDLAIAGARDVKDSVRVATTAALPANTPAGSGVGKTLTMNAIGVLTVDGIATVLNDRILVKNEGSGQHNGLYKVTTEGTGAVAAVLTRATDSDSNAEVTAGLFVFAEEGTTNADSGWLLTNDGAVTLDTTALTFTQVSGLGQVTAGAGLTKTGNTLDVGAGNGIQVNVDSVEVLYGLVGVLTTVDAGSAAAAGTANTAARSDHEHPVTTGAAVELTDSTNAEGAGAALARAAHTHAHGVRGGGTLHAAATASVAGFMSAADKVKLDNLGETQDDTVQTTDATVTNLGTFTPAVSTAYTVEALVTGKKSGDTQMAGYKLLAMFRKNGAGTITQVGTTLVVGQNEDDAAWDATLDGSAGDIRLRVTGVAATTIDWASTMILRKHA